MGELGAAAVAPGPTTSSSNGSATGGNQNPTPAQELAEYEKERDALKFLIASRNDIAQNLSRIEQKIVELESRYIETTPHGNILTGFDNYTKGVSGAAHRRKTGTVERVFSRSSISYNSLNMLDNLSGTSTPTAGPTPINTSFSASQNAKDPTATAATTPVPATEAKKATTDKARKRVGDDAEPDTGVKRIRTHFGAARK